MTIPLIFPDLYKYMRLRSNKYFRECSESYFLKVRFFPSKRNVTNATRGSYTCFTSQSCSYACFTTSQQCLELVGKSVLSIPPNTTTSLLNGLLHFKYPLSLEVRAIPYRSQMLLKTWAFSWTIPYHSPSIPKQDGCCI